MNPLESRSLAALLFAGVLAGCGARAPNQPVAPVVDPIEARKLAPEIAADARPLVEANNQFALELYARLRTEPGNLFVSPYSISSAFAMLYAGAATQTEAEMARVFHFPLAQERLHPVFGALQRSLDRGIQLGGYELRLANRAWGQQGLGFEPGYLAITREHYGAEMQAADFVQQSESVRNRINAWVAQRTNDRIRDLFPPESINRYTRLALANAIYFKGLWAVPFEKERTKDAPFHRSAADPVVVATMDREGTLRMGSTANAQVLELPYRGADLSMFILLPHRVDGLAEVEQGLALEGLKQAIAGVRETPGRVRLPRFGFSSRFELCRVLEAMGMPSAFAEGADFSRIDGRRDLSISTVQHQAFVEVNEEGTEAAAATGIGVGVVSLNPNFIADHPFLFFIHDNVTGSILFLGRVVDPSV